MKRGGGLRESDHFRVGRRILKQLALIVGASNDAALQRHDDGTDGHFILGAGQAGFFQGHLHVREVKRVARVGQRQVERNLGQDAAPAGLSLPCGLSTFLDGRIRLGLLRNSDGMEEILRRVFS